MNRSTLIFFRYLFSAVSLPAGLLLLCACFSDIDELAEKARQGDPQAQRDLAYDLYCKGEMENAFLWYRKAAEAGDANAMCNLGTMYLTGRGTSVNQENAVKWLKRAAELGHPAAQKILNSFHQEKHLKIEISIYRISFIKKTYHSIRNKIISAVKQQSTTEDKIFIPHN